VARRGSDWGARLILASRSLDQGYRLLDRIRSELVLAFASDATLDRFNDLAYSSSSEYDPRSSGFRAYLFPWEEHVVDRFFPPPPARVLVGGAGSGREAFALLEQGYEVVAFDPSPALVRLMAAHAPAGSKLEAYRGSYEELPILAPVTGNGKPLHLTDLPAFDASLIGWGSYSHLRTTEHRIGTLRAFGAATDGPVVVSFLQLVSHSSLRRWAELRRSLRARAGRQPGDAFSVNIGFYHVFEDQEVHDLASRARLDVIHFNRDDRETNWPHAVLKRRA
jgi:hypothetical protein